MVRYFFHNVYGDCDNLLNTLPEDVVAVPFGWTPDVEDARNQVLNSLNTSVSCLPSVLYQGQDGTWREVRVADLEQWTWAIIDSLCVDVVAE